MSMLCSGSPASRNADLLFLQEIFGPVLAVYPYPDDQFMQTAELADKTSPYGLTGAIYVQDPEARKKLCETFRDTAGNFYINDKSTGSIVGQQPFGGARLSGESSLCFCHSQSLYSLLPTKPVQSVIHKTLQSVAHKTCTITSPQSLFLSPTKPYNLLPTKPGR